MKTKLATAIMLVGALHVNLASALGLGEIGVDSALNERFAAEIPLVNARSLDPSQIIVSLASASDFARADVERPYFLNNLQFKVMRDERGRQVLQVTTPEVMREPYLNFLLEVRWPNGRMLREYMVLLDLPIYSARSREAVQQPGSNLAVVRKPQVVTRFEPAPAARNRAGSSDRLPAPSTGTSSYTVRSNDSLSKIAKAVKPASVDINQAMLAIQRENPHAFINNNINLLKNGVVLRIPSSGVLASVNSLAANEAVSEQEKVWRNRARRADTGLRALQDARSAAGDSTAAVGPDGRLTLSSEKTSAADRLPRRDGSLAGQAGGAGAPRALEGISSNKEIARLQSELAVSLENLDRAALENESLVERLGEVESKFDDLERLLELKDKELAQVKAALEKRGELLGEASLGSASELVSQTGVDAGSSKPAAPNATPAPVPTLPAADKQGFLENLAGMFSTSVTGLLAALAGLGILLAGMFTWIFARRKDDYQATVFEAPAAPVFVEDDDEFEPAEPMAATPANDDAIDDSGYAETVERSFDGSDDAEPAEPGFIAAGEGDQIETPEDPLAEADIYLAYGRNEQAARMLEVAVEADPLRTDLRMKLLEVYDELGDAAQLEIQRAQILTLDSSLEPEIDDLLGLSGGSGQPDYAQSDTSAADLGLDLDSGSDAASDGGEAASVRPIASEDLEDEVATKLDLARAYIDMGDYDGAREILDEVVEEGSDMQRDEAREMLARFG